MYKKRLPAKNKLTLERIHDDLTIITFSFLALIASSVLLYMGFSDQNTNSRFIPWGFGLGAFSAFGIGSVIGNMLSYYLSKTWVWFNNTYPKYGRYYKMCAVVLFFAVLLYLKLLTLSIVVGSIAMIVLNRVVEDIYPKRKKPVQQKKRNA